MVKPPSAAEKQFIAQCNRVRALISFHKIKSLSQAAKELGLEHLLIPSEYHAPITPALFNQWLDYIKPFRLLPFPTQENIKDFWKESDFEIESKIYEGYVSTPPKKLTPKERYEKLLPPKNPNQKAECLYFQYDCDLEVFNAITQEDKRGVYVRANTGDGKTYFAGQLLRWLIDSGFTDKYSVSPWKILYVTGPSIIEQTIEALQEFGLKVPEDVEVTNYEALRASFGARKFIKKNLVVEDGEEHELWEWNKMLHPVVIIWDEAHKLKNEGSIQSKIGAACNNLDYDNPFTGEKARIYQVFMSASPFSKISQAKVFACATKKKWKAKDGRLITINNANWKSISQAIAYPDSPDDFSRKAIKKFLREFKDYIYPFKNVRRKHRGILQTEFLDFWDDADAKEYKEAWDKFLEFKKNVEGKEYAQSRFLLLVQLNVFRQAAEKLRKRHLAKFMYETWAKGKAPVVACAFKSTIALTVKLLIDDYNFSRDDISIIWGGSSAFSGAKGEVFSPEEIRDYFKACMLDPENVDMKKVKKIHAQLQAENDGLKDMDKSLRLGIQSRDARNEERKRFQTGKSKLCMFTFGAGKEGLSLHQNEEYLWPREQANTPVYNEMEMLQAEGRTARITSLSDTLIRTFVFRNTIEVPVLHRVMAKRQCLEVVRTHGDRAEAELSQIEDLMKLAGLEEKGSDEDEDLEEQVFAELEDEMNKEDGEEGE